LFTYHKNNSTFFFDTRQIKEKLDGVPIASSPVLSFLRNYLSTSLSDIHKQDT